MEQCSVVPLRWKGEDIGGLFIGDDVGRTFTPEVVRRLLQGFADQAAISLGNAELMAKDAAKLKRLEKLSRATKEITENLGTTTLRERLHLIARHVTEILDAEVSCVLLKQPSGELRLEEGYGYRADSFEGRQAVPPSAVDRAWALPATSPTWDAHGARTVMS